jgi:hypothetical protein
VVRLPRLLLLTVLCSMPIASVEATPWELTFDGTLHKGLLAGTTYHARFIYENPLNLEPGSDLGDGVRAKVLFASVAFNDLVYFSQWSPTFDFLLGGSGLYGPQFHLTPQFMPAGLSLFAFAETRVLWGDTVDTPFQPDDCQFVGSGALGECYVFARQLPSQVPEPATVSLVVIGAGLTAWLRRRRRSTV